MAQMEVSYSRRLDYQYMMIAAGEDVGSDYRLSMLIHNRINGFLPVHIQQINGNSTLSYEITSLEALPSFLDARKITYDEMVSLLLQFCSAVQEVGRYLLDGEGILLEPQYIYVSKSLEAARFCYYPYQHTPLYQSVNLLCRFLIDHIDYDDRKSLELAYGLFQESLKENLSIRVIVGCIKNKLETKANEKSVFEEKSESNEELLKKQLKQQMDESEQNRKQSISEVQKRQQQERKLLQKAKTSETDSFKDQKKFSSKKKSIMPVLCTLLVIALFCWILFTAGRRLLQLELISENMLIAAGILIVAVAAIAGVIAYQILKPKH